MASAIHHAASAQRKWGGCVEDYVPISIWFDETKNHMPDMRHRAIRHHAQGVDWCEQVFGLRLYLHNEDGSPLMMGSVLSEAEPRWIPVRWVAERHIKEDMGRIPTVADWLRELPMEPSWMAARAVSGEKLMQQGESHATTSE